MAFLRLPSWSIFMVALACFIQVDFMYKTDMFTWAPDIYGHQNYIEYLLAHDFMPPPPAGWQRQQPFLFYQWAASSYVLAQWLGIEDSWHVVRLSSRLLYMVYMICGLLLIKRFRLPRLAYIAAVSIIVFWPLGYQISTRVNNDLGFMALFMAMLLSLQLWHENAKPQYLGSALILAAASFLCKATGAISFMSVFGLILYHIFAGHRLNWGYFIKKSLYLPIFSVVISLLIYFGRIGYYIAGGQKINLFANVQPGEVPYTPLNVDQLFVFNLIDFIRNPAYSWDIANINGYTFWDYMFRTLLFGMEVIKPLYVASAVAMFWAIILALFIVEIVAFFRAPGVLREYVPSLIAGGMMLVLLMIQRSIIPDRYLANGRYIYPIIVIVAIMVAGLARRLQAGGHQMAYYLCVLPIFLFVMMSIILNLYGNFP